VPGYLGFEAEDVSVHWWSLYYHFGERLQISQDLTLMLRELHRQDILVSGPMLPHLETILDCWPQTAVEVLAPQFVEKPAHQCVTNYTTAHVEGLAKKCNVSMVGLNLSQISVDYHSDVDSDHVDYDITGVSTGKECELESDLEFGKPVAEKGRPRVVFWSFWPLRGSILALPPHQSIGVQVTPTGSSGECGCRRLRTWRDSQR
jgi:hypothetical protein